MDLGRVVELLHQDPDKLPPEQVTELVGHFRARVNEVRDRGEPHLHGIFSFLKSKSELHGLTIGHGHWELQVEETDLSAIDWIGP